VHVDMYECNRNFKLKLYCGLSCDTHVLTHIHYKGILLGPLYKASMLNMKAPSGLNYSSLGRAENCEKKNIQMS